MKSILYRLRTCCALSLLMAGPAIAQDFQAEFDRQWGLRMIGVDKALEKGLDGTGVKVGIADSGLQVGGALHPELEGRYLGLGLDGFGGNLDDVNGHGTHVAGIIAANRDGKGMMGVASGAEIVPLRLLLDGASFEAHQIAAAEGYRYALEQGVRIFNASYGVPGMYSEYTPEMIETYASPELNAYREVVDAGGVIVFAAGNDSWPEPSIPGGLPMLFPELVPGWMTVASVGPSGNLAWYSQACGATMSFCLSAPGGDDTFGPQDMIDSTWLDGGYAPEMGTSMAAPHVTGALAIAKQLYPNASYQELAQLVFQTATDIGDEGLDEIYGWGLLNVGNMVATNAPEAGAIYAQAQWSHAMTLNHVADVIEARSIEGNPERYGFWLTPFGSLADLSLGNAALSGRYTTGGMIGGVDYALDDRWKIGAALGFSQSRFAADNGNRAEDTSYHAAPYVAFDDNTFFASAAFGGSYFSGKTRRVSAPGMGGTILGNMGLDIAGDQNDRALWATARAGGHVDLDGVKASPYVFGRIARQYLGAVDETGTSILTLDAASARSVNSEVGVGVKVSAAPVALKDFTATPSLNVAYGRGFGDFSRTVQILGSTVNSEIRPSKNRVQLQADLLLTRPGTNFDGTLSYRTSLSSDVVSHSFSANLGIRF